MKSPRSGILTRTDGVLALAAVAVAAIAIGCGKQKGETVSSTAGTTEVTAVAETPSVVNAATPAAAIATLTPEVEGTESTLADSLPPDVTATIPDVSITPGQVIEIAAETSPDVVEVTLRDGLGTTQPFAYDTAAKAWRVLYRVPLKAKTQTLGLSIKATNSLHRWKRVWLFPNREGAGADSSGC